MKSNIVFIVLLTFSLFHTSNAEEIYERPCSKDDLIGIWTLSLGKNIGNLEPSYQDLAQPTQIRVYSKDNSFKQLSSNNTLSKQQIRNLLSISQNQSYVVHNGFVATINTKNKVLDRYECSYFYKDFPKGNLKAGTLSLLWLKNNQPYILNTYVRFDLDK